MGKGDVAIPFAHTNNLVIILLFLSYKEYNYSRNNQYHNNYDQYNDP